MLEYHVSAHRLDSHGSLVAAKEASLIADTDLAGRPDAFNPVELLLGALSACLIKGAEESGMRHTSALRPAEGKAAAIRSSGSSSA
jgi:uncharacterized OsmC-like protein